MKRGAAFMAESAEARYARAAHRFEIPLLVAAALVIPALVIEQSRTSDQWAGVAQALNWTIWLAFLTESSVLLYLAPDRRRWLREHPLEVLIIVLTPPFLATLFQPIRALRLLRLLRLVRFVQLSRRLFSLEGLKFAAMLTVCTALIGGAAFSSLEKNISLADGFYWAITTITTVGSHIEPRTAGGKMLTVVLVIVGAGFVAVLTGAIAQRFVAHSTDAAKAEATLLEELQALSRRLHRIEQLIDRLPDERSGHDSESVVGQ
jgi:voltage-gated potassium channel